MRPRRIGMPQGDSERAHASRALLFKDLTADVSDKDFTAYVRVLDIVHRLCADPACHV